MLSLSTGVIVLSLNFLKDVHLPLYGSIGTALGLLCFIVSIFFWLQSSRKALELRDDLLKGFTQAGARDSKGEIVNENWAKELSAKVNPKANYINCRFRWQCSFFLAGMGFWTILAIIWLLLPKR